MGISENSRVWVYQANRILTEDEETLIQRKLDNFTSAWQAHGNTLDALGEIRYHQDESVYLMKEIEKEFDLDLFDRFRIAYRDGDNIINCSREEFEDLLKTGTLDQDTIVFNSMISSRREMQSGWQIPMKDSWHAQVFL